MRTADADNQLSPFTQVLIVADDRPSTYNDFFPNNFLRI